MNSIDTSVIINDIEWAVHTCEMESVNIGLTDYRHCEISLESNLKSDTLIRTLKHELTHAIIYSYGLDQIGKFSQEVVCDFMANYSDLLNDLTQQVLKNEYTELQDHEVAEIEFETDLND